MKLQQSWFYCLTIIIYFIVILARGGWKNFNLHFVCNQLSCVFLAEIFTSFFRRIAGNYQLVDIGSGLGYLGKIIG